MNKMISKLKKDKIQIIKVVNKELKASQTNDFFSSYISHTFPETPIIVVSISANSTKTSYLKYVNKNRTTTTCVVPNNMLVSTIPLKEQKKMKEVYRDYIIKNLKDQLHFRCMLGSDPEIFVENQKGNVIPAFKFLGSKKSPNNYGIGEHQYIENKPIYWDGFQAEFETSANTCLAWQVDSVQQGLKGTLDAALKYDKDAKLSIQTVMDIPDDLLKNEAEEHVEFGCMPSLNIYNMKGKIVSGRDLPYRSAGGHIHFGFEGIKKTKVEIERIIKSLDAILGVACVALFAKYDNPKRRECYGLAGEYRLPKHGIEYRVLSNAWLSHPLIMNLVFDLARKALVFGQKDFLKYWKATEKETINCINNCDVNKAKTILNNNKDIMLQLFQASYRCDNHQAKKIFNIFLNGMESIVKDPSDLVTNWNLKGDNCSWVKHSDGKGKNYRMSEDYISDGKKVA